MRTLATLHLLALAMPAAAQAPLPIQSSTVVGPWAQNHGAVLGAPRGGAWSVARHDPPAMDVVRIERLSDQGDRLWSREVTHPVTGGTIGPNTLRIAPDDSDGAYVAMSVEGPTLGSVEVRVLHLADDGTLLASTPVALPGSGLVVFDLIPDSAGGVIFAASGAVTSLGSGIVVGRVLPDGTLAWTDAAGSSGWRLAGGGIALDAAGNITWIGHAYSGSVTVVMKRDWTTAGAPLGQTWLSGNDWSGNVDVRHVAGDAAGHVLIGGRNDLSAGQISRVLPDGTVVWTTVLGGASSWVSAFERVDTGPWWVAHGAPATPSNELSLTALSPSGQILDSTSIPGVGVDVLALDVDARGSVWTAVLAPADPTSLHPEIELNRFVAEPSSVATCGGEMNSTGAPAIGGAVGSSLLADGDVTLFGAGLPPMAFGFFVTGRTGGFVPHPGASDGNLCLTGAIGRLNRPGEVFLSDGAGRAHVVIDPGDVPNGQGGVAAITAGETWHFQAWYRDANPAPSSNFTGAFTLTLQ